MSPFLRLLTSLPALLFLVGPWQVLAGDTGHTEADEDAIFGGTGADSDPDEDAIFGGTGADSDPDEDAIFGAGGSASSTGGPSGFLGKLIPASDPLSIGGQLYLRSSATFSDRGALGEQRFAMPNILDLYLDARPEERVRAFISGRLRYDPTVQEGSVGAFGQSQTALRATLDELWLKTDIARAVFITLGQERVKWGAARIWTPNDFLNTASREPLTLFDERPGVPLLKLHIPYETFNLYLVGLFGGVSQLDDFGGAFRAEAAFGTTEIALSAVAGGGRKTALGFDISTGLWDLDLTADLSLTDERDTTIYSGELDFEKGIFPSASTHGRWAPRLSVGLQYAFKPNDDDLMFLALEYFYNPLGTTQASLYPLLVATGDFRPFYTGQHYLGLTWLIPQPGSWNDSSFTVSGIGNLSDLSFVARVDFSQTLHTLLKLEAYLQGHFGHRGGELRFALDLPELPPIPGYLDEGLGPLTIPAPALLLGLNLRLAI